VNSAPPRPDRRTVRANFARAAPHYAAAAALQHAVEDQLLERLEVLKAPPSVVLDVGCGPGRGALALRERFPNAHIIALDFAAPMLAQLPARSGLAKLLGSFSATPPIARLLGDAMALPLAGGTVDALFSSLCIQWCPDLATLFGEWRRVLKPGALVLFATFGPDTLTELRTAWHAADARAHVNQFLDMHDIGDALLRAGFRDPVLETEHYRLSYPDVRALLHELKAIGANNALSGRGSGLGGKTALADMFKAYPVGADSRIEATYEVVFALAYAPPPGAPIRNGANAGEIASVPISAVRRR
jgi:malonyl-CoA O-methyltransferase